MFLCIYLPYECDMFYDDYCFYLNKLQCIIESANTPHVFILGDYNADIQSESVFGSELINFCDMNSLCFIDRSLLLPDTFTFVSQAHGTTSWLDHCVSTTSGKSLVSNVSIKDNVVCSDHFPLCIDINCDFTPIFSRTFVKQNRSICKWNIARDDDKLKYSHRTNNLLSNIELPIEALLCRNANCISLLNTIDCFYTRIINSLKSAESDCIPSTPGAPSSHIVPGWNDYVKEFHAAARNAFWWWNLNKRPRHGIIYHNMRTTRSQFKYALRSAKKAEETARADALAEDLCNKKCDEFWRGMKKLNQSNSVHATIIDNITGDDNISKYWKNHFYTILNSNIVDECLKSSIVNTLDDIQYSEGMNVICTDVSLLISQLECGKSAGPDGVCAEAIKFSHCRIGILLSLFFTLCLSHGYLPPAMIETTIVPIVKNKCGNITDSNNYRPIALATIVSKLFESVLLLKCEYYLPRVLINLDFKKHTALTYVYML